MTTLASNSLQLTPCVVCNLPIEDPDLANAQWRKGKYDPVADVCFVHKGDCSASTEKSMPIWMPFDTYERLMEYPEFTNQPVWFDPPEPKPQPERKPLVIRADPKFEDCCADKWQAYFSSRSEAVQSVLQSLVRKYGPDEEVIRLKFERTALCAAWEDPHKGPGSKWYRLAETEMARAIKYVEDHPSETAAPVMEEYVSPALPSNTVPRFEAERVDYLDQLAEEITDGTMLPFNFARETFKMLLLAGLPQTPELGFNKQVHNRQYVVLLSDTAGSGKGESWRRAWATLCKTAGFMQQFKYREIMGSRLGSPESAVLEFGGQIEGKPKDKEKAPLILTSNIMRNVVHYDEGKKMLVKDASGTHGRGLVSMFTTLYESNRDGFGSIKNGRAQVDNANVSLMMHFVRESFDQAFAGTEAGSDGFLSRCTLVADHKNDVRGDWRVVDSRRVQELMERVVACMGRSEVMLTPEANAERLAAVATIRGWDARLAARLEAHFCQDIMARAIFGPHEQTREPQDDDGPFAEPVRVAVADAGVVRRAFAWTQHQYETRRVVWPEDSAADKYERMGRLLDKAVEKHGALSRRDLARAVNLSRLGSGGWVVFDRALKASDLVVVGQTRKGAPIYGNRGE